MTIFYAAEFLALAFLPLWGQSLVPGHRSVPPTLPLRTPRTTWRRL